MGLVTRRRLLGAALAGVGAALAGLGFRRRRHPAAVHVRSSEDLLFESVRLFDGERFLDGPRWVLVNGGSVVGIERGSIARRGAKRRAGGALLPGFVDAHVHLSFSSGREVFAGGVTAVLDLGEPLAYAFAFDAPVRFRAAGPLITAPGGYPTRSWGANGYGLEVASTADAREAVAMLADRGAALIKVAIEPDAGPVLDAEVLRAVVAVAHAKRLKVAAHALGLAAVRGALDAGVDVLAHTPVEPLPDDLVRAAGSRSVIVISTVRAFGGRDSTRANLAALAAAGCPVVYGTDLGNNGIRPGIDTQEIEILETALGGREQALRAATSGAGALAGVGGRVAVGSPADLVWCPALDSAADLRRNIEVWVGRT
jgi:imidazolonepropionase-like amidohydrolase